MEVEKINGPILHTFSKQSQPNLLIDLIRA